MVRKPRCSGREPAGSGYVCLPFPAAGLGLVPRDQLLSRHQSPLSPRVHFGRRKMVSLLQNPGSLQSRRPGDTEAPPPASGVHFGRLVSIWICRPRVEEPIRIYRGVNNVNLSCLCPNLIYYLADEVSVSTFSCGRPLVLLIKLFRGPSQSTHYKKNSGICTSPCLIFPSLRSYDLLAKDGELLRLSHYHIPSTFEQVSQNR